ncbi:hypothetical protein KPSA3_02798 [Pseudomonas syringae pv. actinidiae]|uniref:Uncharacterized protein n=1 Tax=Pseudomonas syringae pv. actinidiae TaxID=103796 RepID=A0AAN4Q404_PSESF|nr:hypothetical protein KPSA3_02798 [Pseudomonas syringae pv. actinidiae]
MLNSLLKLCATYLAIRADERQRIVPRGPEKIGNFVGGHRR